MTEDVHPRCERPRKQKNRRTEEEEEVEKKKFPTSEDVYKRILWDERFDPNMFEIGYEDRFRGLMFMPLRNFRGTGDATSEVPFHRVQLIRSSGLVVWDRASRLYTLESWSSEAASQAPVIHPVPMVEEPRGGPPGSHTVGIHSGYWNGSSWTTGENTALVPAPEKGMKLLTFNMLFSNFEASVFSPSTRLGIFLRELEKEDPDIVSLQEVTPDAWGVLKNSDYIRRTYHLCDINGVCVTPTGQGILSKYPFFCSWILPFGPVKRAVFGRLTTHFGGMFVSAIHLSSDFSRDNSTTRQFEFEKVASELSKEENSLIMGDFNFGDEGPEIRAIDWKGFQDVWHSADTGGDSTGFTFDLNANWLAEKNSKNHRYPRRLDRILFRSPRIKPITASVCLKATEGYRGQDNKEVDMFASDHFGVSCTCQVLNSDPELAGSSSSSNEVNEELGMIPRTLELYVKYTVCMIPTPDTWPVINNIRIEFDPVYFRWPPHINLLYPFAVEAQFELLAPHMQLALREIEPFEVTLEDLDTFGGRSKYIFAKPDKKSTAAMTRVYERLVAAIPPCKTGKSYSPHLTVAQFDTQKHEMGIKGLLGNLRNRFSPVQFKVSHVHMMARTGADDPFRIVHSVPLGIGRSQAFPSPWETYPGWPPSQP